MSAFFQIEAAGPAEAKGAPSNLAAPSPPKAEKRRLGPNGAVVSRRNSSML
jgi:hypothetical protein